MNEVGVVEPDNKEITIKQEIDHDDLNSIETLSASECEDEEDALPERETYEVINTGSSGGKFFLFFYSRKKCFFMTLQVKADLHTEEFKRYGFFGLKEIQMELFRLKIGFDPYLYDVMGMSYL